MKRFLIKSNKTGAETEVTEQHWDDMAGRGIQGNFSIVKELSEKPKETADAVEKAKAKAPPEAKASDKDQDADKE